MSDDDLSMMEETGPGLWIETFARVGVFLKALEDAGWGLTDLKRLRAFPGFIKRLYRFYRDGCVSPVSLEVAHEIMGGNMVAIDEARRIFPSQQMVVSGSLNLLQAFAPFDRGLLEACKNTHLLIPGLPVTFGEMVEVAARARRPFVCVHRIGKTMQRGDLQRCRGQKVLMGWMLVKKAPIAHSPGCNYARLASRYLGPDDFMPTLESLVYAATVALETRCYAILSKANAAPVFTPTTSGDEFFGAGFLKNGVIEISSFPQDGGGVNVLLTSAKRPLFELEQWTP